MVENENEIYNRHSKIEVEVSAMKEKLNFVSLVNEKFDNTLDRLHELMEERRSDTNKDLKDVYDKIENVENKIMAEISKLRDDVKEHHQTESRKIADLDKWRWIMFGGAAVVGWILSKISYFIANVYK